MNHRHPPAAAGADSWADSCRPPDGGVPGAAPWIREPGRRPGRGAPRSIDSPSPTVFTPGDTVAVKFRRPVSVMRARAVR